MALLDHLHFVHSRYALCGTVGGLTEEELALFDILTKPEIDITDKEMGEVKKVSRTLLQTLKEAKLVLDWRKKQRTRADVYTTVKTLLDELPRAYTPELYQQKCDPSNPDPT